MSENVLKKLSNAEKIKWGMLLIVIAILYFIPAGEVYTAAVKGFCIVTIAGIYLVAFELLPAYIAATLIPVGYWVLNVVPAGVAFGSWTQQFPWIILGAFMVAHILQKTGVSKRLAYSLMLLAKGNFYIVIAMIMVAGVIMAMFVPAAIARVAIFGAIALSIRDAMGWKDDTKKTIILIMGVYFATSAASYLWYTGSNANVIVAGMLESANYGVTWTEWAIYNALPGLITIAVQMIVVIFFVSKFCKDDGQSLNAAEMSAHIKKEYAKLGKMDGQEIKATIMLVVLFLLLLTNGQLHSWNPGQIFIVLALIAYLPGIRLLENSDTKQINFSVVFLITGFIAIGDAATSLGLGDVFVEKALPYLPHSVYGLSAISFFIAFFGNMLMTPLAISSAFTVPMINIANTLGINPTGLIMIFYNSCMATLFPYEVNSDILLFSYGLISMKNYIKIGVIRSVLTLLALFIIYIPWFKILGIM